MNQHEVNIQSSKANVSSLGNAYIPSDKVIVSKTKDILEFPLLTLIMFSLRDWWEMWGIIQVAQYGSK